MSTEQDLKAELERLRLENAKLKAVKEKARVRRAKNGKISVYVRGQRWPLTATPAMWREIIEERAPEIKRLAKEMHRESANNVVKISTAGKREE